jgi:hypothetical protein
MTEPEITDQQRDTLLRVYEDLRGLADHPSPAVRGGVRLALADVAQVLNALDLRYELYSKDLA